MLAIRLAARFRRETGGADLWDLVADEEQWELKVQNVRLEFLAQVERYEREREEIERFVSDMETVVALRGGCASGPWETLIHRVRALVHPMTREAA